jgi:hypothetical protein
MSDRYSITSPAPVALFVYNRPLHTRRTVEALSRNELADISSLFVFCDAARSDKDRQQVREVREYAASITGFKSVTLVERERNLGLAQSIITGVTELVNAHGRVIVLEDDLVTSPYFLRYMNDALSLYQNEERVMHVSGGAYPVDFASPDDTFFLRIPLCWGWGTWRRAWAAFENNIAVMNKFDHASKQQFDFDSTYSYWKQLEMNRDGQLNTWFVFWYATLFLQGGLALFPSKPLVMNIGHDGTGVHCGKTRAYDVQITQKPVSVLPIPVIESQEAVEAHKRYFLGLKPNVVVKTFQTVKRIAKRLLI